MNVLEEMMRDPLSLGIAKIESIVSLNEEAAFDVVFNRHVELLSIVRVDRVLVHRHNHLRHLVQEQTI